MLPQSHLLQMRGLKPKIHEHVTGFLRSHLLQMRGLKPTVGSNATFAGIASHLLQMRGLKQMLTVDRNSLDYSRIFYRCVD